MRTRDLWVSLVLATLLIAGTTGCGDSGTAGGDEAECGNGEVEVGETCDNGNVVDGDGCSAACTLEYCGNGTLEGDEVCDDGNQLAGDGCAPDCLSDETCGNGTLDKGVGETCDDGNMTYWDGCAPDCTEPADPCAYSPCRNGGTCVLTGPGIFTCSCGAGFSGPLCENTEITLGAETEWLDLETGTVHTVMGPADPVPPEADFKISCCYNKSLIYLNSGVEYAILSGVQYDDVTAADISGASFTSSSPGQCSEYWQLNQVYLIRTNTSVVFKATKIDEPSVCNPTIAFRSL